MPYELSLHHHPWIPCTTQSLICRQHYSILLYPDSQYPFAFMLRVYSWKTLSSDLDLPGGGAPEQNWLLSDGFSIKGGLSFRLQLALWGPAECGQRASLSKLQLFPPEAAYFGLILERALFNNLPPHKSKTVMLSCLGMWNYCRHWFNDDAAMDSIWCAATVRSAPPTSNEKRMSMKPFII